jgi:cell division protein FtsB
MKAQISKGIMKRLAMLLVPFLAVGALTVAAHADKLAALDTQIADADDRLKSLRARRAAMIDAAREAIRQKAAEIENLK